MGKLKTLVWEKINYAAVTQFAVLVGVATVAPMFFSQAITGSIVNATLFAAAALLGLRSAVLVAIVPSLIALSIGQLPAVLAPMVPFIMISNILLMAAFLYFSRKNYWVGIVSASFLKFLFLFGTSQLAIHFIIKSQLAAKISIMMSWPQLLTALAGGIIAFGFLKFFLKR